jgi:hypothetical protein
MMQVNKTFLRRWYIGRACFSTPWALLAIAFPRWPRALDLNAEALDSRLNSAGFQIQRLPSRAPTRTYDLASSQQIIWKLANGQELSLMRATSREHLNFQLAFLTRAQPKLQLNQRQLSTDPMPFARGHQDKKNMIQTCIVIGGKGKSELGVSHEQLNNVQSRLASSLTDRIATFLVMAPPSRNSCVVATLSSQRTSPEPDISLFKNLIHTIIPDLIRHDSTRSPGPLV